MLSTSQITMQFGPKPLFENVTVKFSEGNRYGLIGANGSGKSTFMKILSGKIIPSAGQVMFPPHMRMASLNQDQFAFENYTVLDTVLMGHVKMWGIMQERDRIYSLAEMSDADGIYVGDLEATFAELDGYTAEARAGELLLGVGIPLTYHQGLMQQVAPGLKLRVLLAQALFSDPDILLLDEPTNNLDIHTIHWLESILNARKATMIIISHDRHFLNTVCTHMADLDYSTIRLYPGNYDDYMFAATQAREKQQAENARKKAKISELQDFVSRFSANASKARQATSRVKQIEKLKVEDIVISSRKSPFIRFDSGKKMYRTVLELQELAQGYEKLPLLFEKINIPISAGEKVAIIGTNGVGKTTLLRTIIGELQPKNGYVKWAENIELGYYAQDHAQNFVEKQTLYQWMHQCGKPEDDEQMIRGTLGRLLFSKDDISKFVQVLSGGEQGRMLFGKIMLQKPNVIIMDEPTNHMDMESIEALNYALENYAGTLIFVSHDREFVSSLATRVIEIKTDKVIDYKGTYEEYLQSQGVGG